MKLPCCSGPVGAVALIIILATGIELYHLNQHENYCKTHSQWLDTLPRDIRNQLR
jgi:hypothetical protein